MNRTFRLWDNEEKRVIEVVAKKVGRNQWMAKCPFHDDKIDSLSINDVKRLYNCFGCGRHGMLYDEKRRTMKRKPLSKEHREWLRKRGHDYNNETIDRFCIHSRGKKIIEYLYQGCSRYIDIKEKRKMRWTSKKGFKARLIGEFWDGQEIIIFEGEHDFFIAYQLGLKGCATYTAGCQSTPKEEDLEKLRGKEIAIIYDTDKAGRSGSYKLCERLVNKARSVKNIGLPIEEGKGNDFTDWVNNCGGTAEKLKEIIRKSGEYEKGKVVDVDGCSVWQEDGVYMKGEKEKREISNFVFKPRKVIYLNGNPFYRVDIQTKENEIVRDIDLPPNTWESRKNIIRSIEKSLTAGFMGSDLDAQEIKRLCAERKINKYRGTNIMGYQTHNGKPIWILPQMVLDKDGIIEDSEIEYISEVESPLENQVDYKHVSDDRYKEISEKIKKHLEKINKPEVVLPITGWYFSNPFKTRFMKKQGHYPLLNCYGTKGSGKTSTLRIFNNLFGLRKREMFSATDTEFYTIKLLSSTNGIPIVFDEYRPWDMKGETNKRIKHYTIIAYDGQIKGRGRADQSIIQYNINAPIVVAGEQRLSERGHFDRCLMINFTPKTIKEKEYMKNFRELEKEELSGFAERYIRWTLGINFKNQYKEAEEIVTECLKGSDIDNRWVDNTIAWVFGYRCYLEFLDVGIDRGGMIKAIGTMIEELREEGRERIAVDELIQTLASMASMGKIKPDIDYFMFWEDEGVKAKVLIKMINCIPLFKKYARETEFEGEVLDRRAYMKQLEERKDLYVDEVKGYQWIEGRTHYGTIIDLEKAGKIIKDVSGFDQGLDYLKMGIKREHY